MNPSYLDIVRGLTQTQHGVNSIWGCSGDHNIPIGQRVCFGSLTKSFNSEKTIDITVIMPKKVYNTKSYATSYGLTPFTFDEIVQYLNDLKKIFPFEFDLVEEKRVPETSDNSGIHPFPFGKAGDEVDCFNVTYHISGPHIAFMFILSLQRFLYAFGDSFYLAVALEIKNGGYGYEKMNLFNILNCVISTTSDRTNGGDMYHIYSREFSYLWNSVDLRNMLISRETLAKESSGGSADLYSSMIYCYDSRLRKYAVPNQYFFPGWKDHFDGKKGLLDDVIKTVTDNLKILREYNGFGKKGAERKGKIKSMSKNVSSGINHWPENAIEYFVDKKFDLSKLDK